MSWEPRPLPEVNPETTHYWEGAANGMLLLSECQACGEVFFYPRKICPVCMANDVDPTEAEGIGTLYTYSIAHQLSGWPEEDLPLVNAIVELKEGPRMFSNVVDCDPEVLDVGAEVEVRFVETGKEDIAIPVFEPVE